MDVRLLRAVLTIIETGSLNKAARMLHISQPALTKAIQKLETEIGAPLFTREVKGMRPTIYGEQLGAFARATTVAHDQSLAEIRALREGSSGTITLAGPPIIARWLFPQTVTRVIADFPNVKVKIVERIEGLLESLIEGQSDFVTASISSAIQRRHGLDSMSICDDELVVIARPGHPITKRKTASAQTLASLRWIFSNEGNMFRKRLETYFEAHSVALPEPMIETSSPELIKPIVQMSDCVALTSRMGAQDELKNGKLVAIRIKSSLMIRSIGLVWRATHPQPRSARAVIQAAQSICIERGYRPTISKFEKNIT